MILVTGGSGLLGNTLIQTLLEKGKKVRALVHRSKIEIEHPHLELFEASLLDVVKLENALEGVDDVYHCAGFVSYAPGMSHLLYKVNVEGTANLVNASLEAGIRKFIHVSSVSTLAGNKNGEMVSEQQPWTATKSLSTYGKTKYMGEMEVWRAMAEGLNAAIVNPSIILGYGKWESGSASLFKNTYREFPWYSEGMTGFVDVKDVAKAMILLMESDVSNDRFILSAENQTFQHVFNCMAKNYGKKPPYRKATPLLASLVWRWEKLKSSFTGKEPVVTKETVRVAFQQTRYNNEKFLAQFPGFAYKPLEQTISESCLAFQQKLNTA